MCNQAYNFFRVSKEWNEFATEIKRTRKQIEWLSLECNEDNDIYVIAEKIKNFTEVHTKINGYKESIIFCLHLASNVHKLLHLHLLF